MLAQIHCGAFESSRLSTVTQYTRQLGKSLGQIE